MKISALISDVDGTLVTSAKTLSARSREAVAALRGRGIAFAVISGRPPRGMQMLVEPLGLTAPLAGFNGGLFAATDLSPLEAHTLAPETARCTHDLLTARGVDVWVFSGHDWLLTRTDGPRVTTEVRAVHFPPTVVDTLHPALASAYKVVGVSDDPALLARCQHDLQAALGGEASASRSQPYYLDVTHPRANKGVAVTRLAAFMDVPMEEVAVIGDGHNDLGMFAQSGLSIAMGNAAPEVQRQARYVTGTNDDDGFAEAIHRYILDA